MDVGRRKGAAAPRNGVLAGSVWESRMKLDDVKGGIKVFDGEEDCNSEENDGKDSGTNGKSDVVQVAKRVNLRPKLSPVGTSGKRKTWKSESLEGSPIQIARQRSEMGKNLDEQCKELCVSADGIKRSPMQNKKKRSEASKELSVSIDGTEKSPNQTVKARSISQKVSCESNDATEKNSIQLRKLKSESSKAPNDGGIEKTPDLRKVKYESAKAVDDSSDGYAKNSLQIVKTKSASSEYFGNNGENSNLVKLVKGQFEKQKVIDESNKSPKESVDRIEKSTVGIKKTRSDEDCKEVSVCEEKVIASNLDNAAAEVKSSAKVQATDDHDDNEEDWDEELFEEADEEIEVEIETKSLVVREISIAEQKTKKVVAEVKKSHHSNQRSVPIPSIVKKQSPPVVNHARVHPSPTKTEPIPASDGFQGIPRTHSKLQSLVDLVMWRDVSKSAFVFGIGTFFIISSSYTKDLNISLISVLSYLGLVYLAAIFLFRSFISREAIDLDDSSLDCVVGEEEAIWLIKLVLPYINEFLLKLKALFSGDPATTMKLAVLLFVLARCGSSITVWKMVKLGFLGVFTVPKVCSSYSTQLAAYGTFWIRRFRDAWDSCSHKKSVAFAIFTLVWNLSSIVARIWAVFMLFVAFRYYRHSFIGGWVGEESRGEDSSSQAQSAGPTQRLRRRPIIADTGKQKRAF